MRRGPGLAAVFVARNRFAVLDKNRQLHIKNFSNETVKKMAPPNPNTDGQYITRPLLPTRPLTSCCWISVGCIYLDFWLLFKASPSN